MTRRAFVLAVPALAACSAGDPPPDPASLVDCAVGGAEDFAHDCSVERARVDGEDILVVRHPGGGLRRFVAKADRTGLAAADGAFEAANSVSGDMLEVRVQDDRYRFPAALDQIGAALAER
ncbi:hypothetical protein QQS45_12800 [Alteriqipengyuania flavescens]|uniref:hypothetical protein n=1 Tax=Alteriqipengyuania flavescens TaxID=3053610 RepID=UPI0025B2E7A8|nr:hypothetical protein [Alteriqipengyuania flavescens]WJY18477.1 hypothetical protein QQW98_12795 [Alteriqipengyuania flavescens]WJY24418.1 hypothetical protein QQS45_12800 [Alteriqipengyuania flavescens]